MLKLLNYFLGGLLYILRSPYTVFVYVLRFAYATLIFTGGEVISFFSYLGGKKYKNEDPLSIKLQQYLDQQTSSFQNQPQTSSNLGYATMMQQVVHNPVQPSINTAVPLGQPFPQQAAPIQQVNVTPVHLDEPQNRGDKS